MKTSIIVRFQFDGIHFWPECPFTEVDFLRTPHRHVFHVELRKRVTHEDRDIEIIMLKRKVEQHCRSQYANAGTKSCETIAREILQQFDLDMVQVLEDGENGAVVEAPFMADLRYSRDVR